MKIFLRSAILSSLFFLLINTNVYADEFDFYVIEGDYSTVFNKPIEYLASYNPYVSDRAKILPDKITLSSEAAKILGLINTERVKNSLKSLSFSQELSELAKQKGDDMYQSNYFGHYSEKYGSFKTMLKDNYVKYIVVGENLAKGFNSAEKVFNAWMKSETHRKNILYSDFDKAGIYFLQTEKGCFWVCNFIKSE